MSSLFDLTGKLAVITGSSKGIGRAMAEEMARHGATVVISSRKAGNCEIVAKKINVELAEEAGRAIAIPANVGDRNSVESLISEVKNKLGNIDILICNAAVNPAYGSMTDLEDSAFKKILDVNIMANHWLCQLVIPDMKRRKDGVIVIVSSIGGLKGHEKLGAYCISKAADLQLVRNLAAELGPFNIRVNSVSPGLVRTDFARALWENPNILEKRTRFDPLRRIGEPEELAGISVYLSSRAGSFTTGQNFIIDGGSTIV